MNNKYYVVLEDVIDTKNEEMDECDIFRGVFSTWELAVQAIKDFQPHEDRYRVKDIIVTAGDMHKVGEHLDLDPSTFINRQMEYKRGILVLYRVIEVIMDELEEV